MMRNATPPSSLRAKSSRPVSDADLKAVRDVGYTDANIIEIVALVAMYSLTNFFNNVFDHDKDFPAVTPAGSI
jgi:alkylhydroperoxidase family enzyme